jgi:putative transposase
LKRRNRACWGGGNICIGGIDRDGALIDVMLSDHRYLAAAKTFFRSARAIAGATPDRVTTDWHDTGPRAIRTVLGKQVWHGTGRFFNNRLELDHRGIKGRCRPMLEFVNTDAVGSFCRAHDEFPGFLRSRSRMPLHHPHPAPDSLPSREPS